MGRDWDCRHYLWDISSRHKSPGNLARMFLHLIKQNITWLARGRTRLSLEPGPAHKARTPGLNLRPGEMVEVLSKEEILATLDANEKNRGLKFFGVMLKYCGGRYRVLSRVDRLVDEITGRTVTGIPDTVMLEGALCDGVSYRGCPRACYWLWREAWLKRID